MFDLLEYKRCKEDVEYFITTYVKIDIVEDVAVSFEMYDYQKEIIELYHNNKFVASAWVRQSGKTTAIIGYLLHYIIFNDDVVVNLLSYNYQNTRNILSKLKKCYSLLPTFFKIDAKLWNRNLIELVNGNIVYANNEVDLNFILNDVTLLVIDEFIYFNKKYNTLITKLFYSGDYYKNQLPKTFITTPSYIFYNDDFFVLHEIDWHSIPNVTDDFKEKMIGFIGGESWKIEYECKIEKPPFPESNLCLQF